MILKVSARVDEEGTTVMSLEFRYLSEAALGLTIITRLMKPNLPDPFPSRRELCTSH